MTRKIPRIIGMVLFTLLAAGAVTMSWAGQSSEALHREALMDFKAGRQDTAISKLEKVIKQDPDATGAYSDLGCCCLVRRNYTRAVECFKRVLSSEPGNTSALANLGFAYLGLNQLDNARDVYRKLTALDPGDTKARAQLAAIYIKERNFDAASLEVKKLLDREPDNPACIKLAVMLHLQKGEREKARDLCKKALAANPDDSELRSISDSIDREENVPAPLLSVSPHGTDKGGKPGTGVFIFFFIVLLLLAMAAILLSVMLKKWSQSTSFFTPSVPLMTGTPGEEKEKEEAPGPVETDQEEMKDLPGENKHDFS